MDARGEIEYLLSNESDSLGVLPEDWEVESEELTIEYIEDEEGNIFSDVDELEDALLEVEY